MANTFVISDTHFGHENACTKFKKCDGSPLRDFPNAAACDAAMIERWNAVVKPFDKVYHLGDVVINRKFLHLVGQLNGKKRLIRGNHDIFPTKDYMQYFDEIYGCRVLDDMILTHIPLHPESITQRFSTNVHGHLHANEVPTIRSVGPGACDMEYTSEPDPRYLCVSVEHTNFTPLSLEEVRERIRVRRERAGYEPKQRPWGNGSPS